MNFAETPWPGIILCGGVALLCLLAYGSSQRRKFLTGVLIAVAVAPLFVLWDELVQTESEQIEAAIVTMADDFRHSNTDAVLVWFHPQDAKLQAIVRTASELVTVTSDVRITSVVVTLSDGEQQATSDFRANAEFDVRGIGGVGRQPTRWLLTWRKFDGQWRIVGIERRNPLTGEPMGVFEKAA